LLTIAAPRALLRLLCRRLVERLVKVAYGPELRCVVGKKFVMKTQQFIEGRVYLPSDSCSIERGRQIELMPASRSSMPSCQASRIQACFCCMVERIA
jgi:hypothetical protein